MKGFGWELSSVILTLFVINLLSALLKGVAASGTTATSVFLDLLNDVGDTVGLGLILAGLRFKSKSSIEYPFGTKRAVYALGLLSIFLFSTTLFIVAVFKTLALVEGSYAISTKAYSVYSFLVAVALNFYAVVLVVKWRRKSKDPAVTSGLIDALSDASGSILALIAMITASTAVDVVGSVAISVVVLVSAATVGYRYFYVLIGRSPPKRVLKEVLNRVLSIPEVKDVNAFNAAMVTEDEYMLILEVEVGKDMDVEDLEKLSAKIEEEVKKVDSRFKHVVIEFVAERHDKTFRRIIGEVEKME